LRKGHRSGIHPGVYARGGEPVAQRKSIPIRTILRNLFPTGLLLDLARSSGAVQRARKVNIVEFFWTLVLGFALGRERTLSGLRRVYEKTTGKKIEESSFYDRFTDGLVAMMKAAAAHALSTSVGVGRALSGPLASFQDVLLTDSTVVRLHDLLAKPFPATRTNHTKAALKAHVILSVRGNGRQSVRVTSERVHDGPVLRVGKWVKERLFLFDLGYFSYHLFACIDQNGGYFLTRLKVNANPTIVSVNRTHRGQSVPVVGERLRDVVGRLQREILDVMVDVCFQRQRYGGQARRDWQTLRVVGIRDPKTGHHHLYITNVPVDKLGAEDIRSTYALRWQIELLFKEMKQVYRLEQMPSKKRVVVEALLYATIVTLLVSRRLLAALRQRWASLADRIPELRWASVLQSVAPELLLIMLRPRREVKALLRRTTALLDYEAVDPNKKRPTLLPAVEARTHEYRQKAL
jgi:putative transposase